MYLSEMKIVDTIKTPNSINVQSAGITIVEISL